MLGQTGVCCCAAVMLKSAIWGPTGIAAGPAERGGKPVKTIAVFFAMLVGAAAIAASTVGGYHLLKTVPVPGDEGWDYCIVDAPARRVYFSHSSHVVVMDADSGALVGKIEKTAGVHGIALIPEMGRGFTSNGQSASSTIFNLKIARTGIVTSHLLVRHSRHLSLKSTPMANLL